MQRQGTGDTAFPLGDPSLAADRVGALPVAKPAAKLLFGLAQLPFDRGDGVLGAGLDSSVTAREPQSFADRFQTLVAPLELSSSVLDLDALLRRRLGSPRDQRSPGRFHVLTVGGRRTQVDQSISRFIECRPGCGGARFELLERLAQPLFLRGSFVDPLPSAAYLYIELPTGGCLCGPLFLRRSVAILLVHAIFLVPSGFELSLGARPSLLRLPFLSR